MEQTRLHTEETKGQAAQGKSAWWTEMAGIALFGNLIAQPN